MTNDINSQLERLGALSDKQLNHVIRVLVNDPAPKWVKDLIRTKVNSLLDLHVVRSI